MPKPNTYTTAQIIFLADLVRNLFANNMFLLQSRNWNAFANGKEVRWNQDGAKPGLVINRNATPLTASQIIDVVRSYELDEFQTMPTRLDWTNEMVINYAKRQSTLENHQKVIESGTAMRILHSWASAAPTTVLTTGAAKAPTLPNAVGNKLAATLDDFLSARAELNHQDIPDDGRRVAVMPSHMEEDITKEIIKDTNKYPGDGVVLDGAIGKIAGFNIYMRSTTLPFNAAGVPQLIQADDDTSLRTGQSTDREGITCYHPDFVTRSISPSSLVTIKPEHGGLEMSATIIAGGSQYRQAGEGIVNIVEDDE